MTRLVDGNLPDPNAVVTGVEAHRESRERLRRALRRRKIDPDDQEDLIRVLATSRNAEHLSMVMDVLGCKRLPRSALAHLSALCRFPNEDVQCGAIACMVRMLSRREGMEHLRQLAADPKCRVKWAVYSTICGLGYREDVPLVAEYVRATVQRGTRSMFTGRGTTLSEYCAFLDEFPTSAEVQKLYTWLKSRWDRLDRDDRESLKRRQPYFGHHRGRKWVLFVTSGGGIGSTRLPNVLYARIPAFGASVLDSDSPRFAAALRVLGREADVIAAIGPTATRRVEKLWGKEMAPLATLPTPDYEGMLDPVSGWAKDVSEAEWLAIAKAEDEEYIAGFRTMLEKVRVR